MTVNYWNLFSASHCANVTNISFNPQWDNDYYDEAGETKINTFLRTDFGSKISAMEIATWDQNFLNGGRFMWKAFRAEGMDIFLWPGMGAIMDSSSHFPKHSPFYCHPHSFLSLPLLPVFFTTFPLSPYHWALISIHSQSSNIKNMVLQPNPKMRRRPKQTFLQRRHTDGQEAHEKLLNITNY